MRKLILMLDIDSLDEKIFSFLKAQVESKLLANHQLEIYFFTSKFEGVISQEKAHIIMTKINSGLEKVNFDCAHDINIDFSETAVTCGNFKTHLQGANSKNILIISSNHYLLHTAKELGCVVIKTYAK